MNLARVIDGHDAASIALIDGDDAISFGELRLRTDILRTQLAARGVGLGDPVGVAAGNEPHFVVASLAILGCGGIVMPLNPTSPVPELRRKIDPVQPKFVLVGETGHELLSSADDISAELIDLNEWALAGTTDETAPVVDRDADDLAFFMPTSGVSGVPKVAMLSHGNLDWIQEALEGIDEPLVATDVTLGALPFAHIFGLNVVMFLSLRAGSRIVLQRRFDVDESLQLVRQHKVTMLTGAPPMWQRWARADVPDDSLQTVRNASSGAAALPLGVFEAVRDRFGIEIAQGYGLTETSPVVTLGRGFAVRPTSVGKVLPGVDVALVDSEGNPVDVGDEGEIVVRSPGVFHGYFDDDATTSSVLTDDGWFWTGDVGIFDDDGYLYLVDRIKDVIIVSGFNVYPAEVETVLMMHPDVTGAIVVGSAHGGTGEMVVAHVSGSATEEELKVHVSEQLSRYKRPTEYHFVDELPIALTGKAIRRAVR